MRLAAEAISGQTWGAQSAGGAVVRSADARDLNSSNINEIGSGHAVSLPTEETISEAIQVARGHRRRGRAGAVGFVAAPGADAATVTLNAGTGSSVTCTITGSVKISPPLMDNWDHTQHTNDPNTNETVKAAMASIPDVPFSAGHVPVTTTSKSTATCSGTAVDPTITTGPNSAPITSATITSTSISSGTNDATCLNLNSSTGSTDLHSIITWKTTASGFKIAASDVHSDVSQLIDGHGAGFKITPTSSTGSFAGGSGETDAYVDKATIDALGDGAASGNPPTFDNGAPLGAFGNPVLCQPTLSEKFTPASSGPAQGSSDAIAIKLKKPKGLKAITIGPALDSTASTLTSSVP